MSSPRKRGPIAPVSIYRLLARSLTRPVVPFATTRYGSPPSRGRRGVRCDDVASAALPHAGDVALVLSQGAALDLLDDVGQHCVRGRRNAELPAVVDHPAVHELDLGAAALHHVLAQRRAMLAAAGLLDRVEAVRVVDAFGLRV